MALTREDAGDIADGFLAAAEAIDTYLDAHRGTISQPDYDTMSGSALALLRDCGAMTTDAVGLAIDEMADDAAELKQVITGAKDSLDRLQAIGAAISAAAGLVDLAGAIVARDPGAAYKAARGLYELADEGRA